MIDWQNARGAEMRPDEREWILRMSAEMAGKFAKPTIVHIGVELGASLVCSLAGAPDARVVGIDLDTSKYVGPPGVELIEGDSTARAQHFHGPVHLLFVDGDHEREGVEADMRAWLGKVRPGGLVVFHDYEQPDFPHTAGVKEAVDGWGWTDTAWEPIDGPGSIVAFRRKPFLTRGESFGTIGIGTPIMRAPYHFFRWWSWLLIGGLEAGDQLLNDDTIECPVPIPVSHNALIRRFLETDRDTLCIVEDDHVGPQDIVRAMRTKAANLDFDILCANYVNRRGLPLPMGYDKMTLINGGAEIQVEINLPKVESSGTQEHEGAAMGLMLCRRWVLDAMLNGGDPEEYQWCEWKGRNSQDLWFYWKARGIGARAGVDRDARIKHIGERLWDFDDFIEARAKIREQTARQTEV